ncbi:MAG: condensation domain-containing protein, partial [Thermoanaerobaculia bacterium]
VFQVLLAVQTAPLAASLPGLELRRLDVDPGIAKFDLSLDLIQEAGGGFSGWLEYDRDLFDAATVKRLARQLGRVLQAVPARPDLKLSELPLASPAERRQVLEEWSRTPGPPGKYRTAGTVHGLFVEQALKTPDKAAVAGRRETLTFRKLDELSSRLALRIKEVVSDRKPSVSPE